MRGSARHQAGTTVGVPRTAKVVSCDDHLLVGELLSVVVEDIDGLEFAGAAADGREAVELVARTGADVLVLDLDMPGYDGLYALRHIRAADEHVRIIVYSGKVTVDSRFAAMEAGADALVRKDETLDTLEEALVEARDSGPRERTRRFTRQSPAPTTASAADDRSATP
jgi:DNA-binding NarL/FixJ family response regulator